MYDNTGSLVAKGLFVILTLFGLLFFTNFLSTTEDASDSGVNANVETSSIVDDYGSTTESEQTTGEKPFTFGNLEVLPSIKITPFAKASISLALTVLSLASVVGLTFTVLRRVLWDSLSPETKDSILNQTPTSTASGFLATVFDSDKYSDIEDRKTTPHEVKKPPTESTIPPAERGAILSPDYKSPPKVSNKSGTFLERGSADYSTLD